MLSVANKVSPTWYEGLLAVLSPGAHKIFKKATNPVFKYHGNYGGPGYTGGKIGGNDFSVGCVDALDGLFRVHDFFYFLGMEKTGDRVLIQQLHSLMPTLSGVLRKKAQAALIGFQIKSITSTDDNKMTQFIGADDLVAKYAKIIPEFKLRLVGIELNPGPPKGDRRARRIRHQELVNQRYQNSKSLRTKGNAVSRALAQGISKLKAGTQHSEAKYNNSRNYNRGQSRPQRRISKAFGIGRGNLGADSGVVVNKSRVIDHFPRRMEKIANVSGTAAFSVNQQLFINPGNSTMFPIFSQIARIYEEYDCKFLAFHYVTEAYSSIGTNASAGKVVMVTNYDPDDANFGSATEAENYEHASRSVPFKNMSHMIKRKRGRGRGFDPLKAWFVNPSANLIAPTSNSTQGKFFDIGNFQLITESNAVTTEIGELWVEFEFDMIRPKQDTDAASNPGSAIHWHNAASNATAASPLGLTSYSSGVVDTGSTMTVINGATLEGYDANTIGLNDAADTILVMPNADARWYLTLYYRTAAANIAAFPTINGFGGATIIANILGGAQGQSGMFTADGTQGVMNATITTTYDPTPTPGATNYVAFGGATGMTAAYLDLFIMRVPNDLSLAPPASVIAERKLVDSRITELENKLQIFIDQSNNSTIRIIEDKSDTDEEYDGVHHCEYPGCEMLIPSDRSLCRKHATPHSSHSKPNDNWGLTDKSPLAMSESTVGVLQQIVNSYKNVSK